MRYLLIFALFLIPCLTLAQSNDDSPSLQNLIIGIGGFINDVLIPFTLGIAFLIFVVNAIRFFVIGGNNTEGQENAKSLAIYGIGAFVLILSLWGLVNILSSGIGLNDEEGAIPDYIDAYGRENIRQADYCRKNPGSIDCR